ncbi:clathrin light chain A-like [Scleropages formosus]|uniref:Clathrin light chain n=1 Tax=Scleropages formosus TaxID=113540 RepID=A0A0P7UIB9_SCLFO|nr:clathrin light chain A-like [Scleropages formosus]
MSRAGEPRGAPVVTTGDQRLAFAVYVCTVRQESNGPSDAYAAVAQVDRLRAEPESLRKWREEQRERLEVLGKAPPLSESQRRRVAAASWLPAPAERVPCATDCRAAEEALLSDADENNPGTEWERVARLCDFNPKSTKQAKDVSRMRSVLISLKQTPLAR